MLTILTIPDEKRFLEMVKNSAGSVLLHLPDDTRIDWEKDEASRHILRFTAPDQKGQFSFSGLPDSPAFICCVAVQADHRLTENNA